MRLICPNCDAEYEVDGSLFPKEGREVQCSNCSNTWFVKVGDDAPADPGPAQTPPQLTPEPETDEPPTAAASEDEPKRQDADPKALGILHAEVEREKRARAEEASGLETQADLGLDDTQTSTTSPDLEPTEAALAPAPRRPEGNKRELLPDIEEINSTLADAPDPELEEGSPEAKAEKGRSSFRLGFGLALIVIASLLIVYAYSPEIAERFPEAAGALQSYVDTVDQLRVNLAEATDALAEKIDALTDRVGNAS